MATPVMQPASERMAERLKEVVLSGGEVPVIHNVNVQQAADEEEMRTLLARQISEPVRWVETVNVMHESGIKQLLECGPGKVLCGLSKRINREMECIPLISMDSISMAMEEGE